MRAGTVVLFTSNKPPSELYTNGLNRQYFLPFVELVQKQLAVIEVRHSIAAQHTCLTLEDVSLCADRTLILPCYAVPSRALLCHVMLCNAMVRMSCHVMLCMPCHAMPCHAVYAMLCMPCCVCHAVYAMPCHAVACSLAMRHFIVQSL